MIVSASWLTNWRVDLAYSPYVIEQLWPKWNSTPEAKSEAEEFAQRFATFDKE